MRSFAFLLLFVGCILAVPTDAKKSKLQRYYRYAEDPFPQCELKVNCKSENALSEDNEFPIKLPIRGPRGPPGENGLQGAPGRAGTPGLPGMPAPPPTKIAFFVGLNNNIGPNTENKDVKFDNIVTNVGGGYQEETGRFRAPLAGVYHFTAVISPIGGHKAACYLMKNGEGVLTIWAESLPFWSSATNSVVLELEKDDEVYLVLMQRASYLHGYMYTTFTGYILFDESSPKVRRHLPPPPPPAT